MTLSHAQASRRDQETLLPPQRDTLRRLNFPGSSPPPLPLSPLSPMYTMPREEHPPLRDSTRLLAAGLLFEYGVMTPNQNPLAPAPPFFLFAARIPPARFLRHQHRPPLLGYSALFLHVTRLGKMSSAV